MLNIGQRLVELSRGAGLTIRPPTGREAIQAFESKYNVVLPTDMREYYLTVDGMEDELDPGMNRFWPYLRDWFTNRYRGKELSERHKDRLAYPGCFLFVDHCIWSWRGPSDWARSRQRGRGRCSKSPPARSLDGKSLRLSRRSWRYTLPTSTVSFEVQRPTPNQPLQQTGAALHPCSVQRRSSGPGR